MSLIRKTEENMYKLLKQLRVVHEFGKVACSSSSFLSHRHRHSHGVALLAVSVVILTHVSVAHPTPNATELMDTKPAFNIKLTRQSILGSEVPAQHKSELFHKRVQRASNKRSKTKRTQRNKKHKQDKKNSKRKEQISAVHFHINTHHSDIVHGTENLKTGIRGDVIPYWKYSDNGMNFQQIFGNLKNDGTFTILQSGLYMVYSQLTYFDRKADGHIPYQ